jgi:hypothetical protein
MAPLTWAVDRWYDFTDWLSEQKWAKHIARLILAAVMLAGLSQLVSWDAPSAI